MPGPDWIIVDGALRRLHLVPDLEVGHAELPGQIEPLAGRRPHLNMLALHQMTQQIFCGALVRAELPDAVKDINNRGWDAAATFIAAPWLMPPLIPDR